MEAFDRLLGTGVVTVAEDGSFQLDDAALGAQLHAPAPATGERCHCRACTAERETERVASLPGYLTILRAERPLDAEEIARVRAELPKRAPAAAPDAQPWHPRPPRNPVVCRENAA